MFDVDFNEWGSPPRKKEKSPKRAYRKITPKEKYGSRYGKAKRRTRTKIVYRDRPKQSQGLSLKEAYGGAKKVYKGAKTTYKGSKVVYGKSKKVYKRATNNRLTGIKQKLSGSIYKKSWLKK